MNRIAIALLLLAPSGQQEKKKVMTTLPVLKAIVEEVAGGDVEAFALAEPDRNPHRKDPTPDLMKKAREADLLIEIGLQLELWAEEVAKGSANPRIQRGAKGRVVAAAGIPREEVPKELTRQEGDVHPEGNPHVWLDPLRAKGVAGNIAAALSEAMPDRRAAFEERLKKFEDRIDEALYGPELVRAAGARVLNRRAQDGTLHSWLKEKKIADKLGGWMKKAAPLRGQKVVEFHKTWVYFARLFGMEIVGSVEPKPGINPTARHLEGLRAAIAAQGVRLILVENYQSAADARALASDTGTKVVTLPTQPGGEKGTETYFAFMDHVIDRMVEGLK